MVCYLIEQSLILALIGVEHGLADGSHDFLLIESYDAPVALNYSLYHILQKFLVDVFSIQSSLLLRAESQRIDAHLLYHGQKSVATRG